MAPLESPTHVTTSVAASNWCRIWHGITGNDPEGSRGSLGGGRDAEGFSRIDRLSGERLIGKSGRTPIDRNSGPGVLAAVCSLRRREQRGRRWPHRRRWDPPPRRILLPEGPAPLTSGSSASAASFPIPARRGCS